MYLLSNASLRQREYWERIPGHEWFDGKVVSAEQHCVKPKPAIYRCLLAAWQLNAGECLFVDDIKENIEAAENEGIRGYLFNGNINTLRRTICRDLSRI